MDWLGDGADLAPDAATEDGPATIEVVATSPTPTADPASETPQDASDFHALDEHAQAAHALRLEVEGLQNNASGHASMEGAAAFGSSLESVELMSSFGDAGSGVSESMTSDYDEYMASQQEAINNAVVLMSVDEKKHSLREIGYSSSTIGQMSGSELDDALSGTLTSHVRFLKIQGMSAVELAQLPVNEQRQFLTDLGVPAADLWKAKDRYIRDAVQQVVAKSKTPGNHSIRLKIRGGFFRKKSYDIQLEVSNEGHLAGVDIEKKGGFFSKLGGFIKTALPIVAKLLAGVTGGLSLVALGIYQGIEAARKGDWVGVITSVAGGLGAAGLDTISRVANGINKAASAAQAGLNAIQAKNPGGILAAISSGAGPSQEPPRIRLANLPPRCPNGQANWLHGATSPMERWAPLRP